ncbi:MULTISPECIES: FeoA family protein [Thiorhodovibrio]|uniref:FeoA family protein n=1 Tax=Thiorhodovibrio TaxID=61593 RepID=UPI0019145604|nr:MULTISPECIES: FeoA family protein [Thiorhodovibrio]MBK5967784.1 hypothetical protein [Thiorhodovibrio winogradskyi]WPL14411.1 FeoA domain protein [Thiorhodovibrio litoralis]
MFDLPPDAASRETCCAASKPGAGPASTVVAGPARDPQAKSARRSGSADVSTGVSAGVATSLADLPLGARARVIGIDGGRELNRRLLALGVRLGSELRIDHHRGRGRVVSIGPTRVALGGSIVEKLRVDPLDSDPASDAATAES